MGWIKRYKLALVVIVLAAGLYGVYVFYFSGDESPALTRTQGASGESAPGGDLLPLLLSLRSVKLDDAVFSSPAFQSLIDFSQVLAPEPIGRSNPFAPL